MLEMSLQNIQTFHAAVLVKVLANKGLEHVIISPGSRSTPLTLAFAMHDGIESHIVIDERSAAFVALGIASATGKPAALVCTSGTAVANYFPAVTEAQRAGLPMIVLSADRDFNEMNTGANQWIDQIDIFGNKAVFFAQVNPRENDERDLSRLEYLAHQAWTEAISNGGCAHLNIPFRKPLEPTDEFLESLEDFYITEGVSNHTFLNPDSTWNAALQLEPFLATSKRPLVIASGGIRNPISFEIIKMLSESGVPIVAEAGSLGPALASMRTFIDGANTFLRHQHTCEALAPDLILRFGDEPVGKGILTFLKAHQHVNTVRFSERSSWSNSSFSPESIIPLHAGMSLAKYDISPISVDPGWMASWSSMAEEVRLKRLQAIEPMEQLRDGDIHAMLSGYVTENELLFVSNSLPARDIDSFGDIALKSRKIFMNRGASGIDGILSSALGVTIATKSPVTLIVGDLAFAHDLSALIAIKNAAESILRIIVINNNGGGIFEMLPVADSPYFDHYFRTSQHVDASALAKGAGLTAYRVSTPNELKYALSTSQRTCVIECITDQNASMAQRRELWS